MVGVAADLGIDTVKFQSWRAARLRPDFPDYEATLERHQRTQLSDEDHWTLKSACEERGVGFLTTCFDSDRIDFLATLGLKEIKVASPDCASYTMIGRLLEVFEHVIVSTGMSYDSEVEELARRFAGENITLLHCVSVYPTPPEQAHLARMRWLRDLGFPVGYSDHTMGVDAGKCAVAMGAEIVEKHFTLSRCLPGKDQAISGEPEEFAELVRWRDAVEALVGAAHPELTGEELRTREVYRGKWGDNT